MKLFKTILMNWREIGLIKFTMLFVGIAIGSTWSSVFASYALIIFTIAIVMGLYSLFSWLKK